MISDEVVLEWLEGRIAKLEDKDLLEALSEYAKRN